MDELNENSLLLNSTYVDYINKSFEKRIENRVLFLGPYGVGDDTYELVILPLLQMINDGTNKEITLLINSYGGSVNTGLVLCDIIDRTTCPIKIVCLGNAYSMAGIILMAGRDNELVKKYCYKHSWCLIHSGSKWLSAESNAFDDNVKLLKRVDDQTNDYIVSHTNITVKDLKKNSKIQWYLDAQEMLEYGIVDEIYE